ncbi:hypothetical protein BJF79_22785 [Actinomadura sp. CNU-125]|uniref:hypothetical protein n=1 Tax=Actinomadura sp. CNU-125 TaxID=1904961 RepID=UPI00096259AF|nr:hypothetical protein [Actinomadura sp. CNU-125]OLT12213.1 hypothetical protein BJF79_22785 [Actinomadura sp. CNU-125]
MFVSAAAAVDTVKTVRALGIEVPAPVLEAEEWVAEVARLVAVPDPPRPPLPDRPGKLAALVDDYVTARAAAAHARNVAATYSSDAHNLLIAAVKGAVPVWVTEMIPAYAQARDAFTGAAPRLPADTTPDQVRALTPTQFRHWQKADRAAYQLDALVKARRDLEKIVAEPVTGRFVDLAAASRVTTVPEGLRCRTTWEQVSAGLKVWRSKGDPVTRWTALTHAADQAALELALADVGTLQPRVNEYEAWLDRMLATAGRLFATT